MGTRTTKLPKAGPVVLALALALPVVVAAAPAAVASTPVGTLSFFAGTGTDGAPTAGPALSSPLGGPYAVAGDANGNVFIADCDNSVLTRVTPAGQLSVIAGTGTSGSPTAGPATASGMKCPFGLVVDAAGNVFIADYDARVVEKVTPAGQLSVVAGNGQQGTAVPGAATGSPLGGPCGVAVDAAGNLFIADYDNSVVEKVTPAGQLSVAVGTGARGATTAGPATSAQLNTPWDVKVDGAGNLFVSDYDNAVVSKVGAGQLTVVAGTGTSGPPTPGAANSSQLGGPADIAVDRAGSLFIADADNHVVEKVTAAGQLSIAAGNGTGGTATDGPAVDSALDYPAGVAFDAAGRLYIADANDHRVNRVTQAPISLGPIPDKYASLGGPASFLGAPVGIEFPVPGGRAQNYGRGVIIWSPRTGAHELHAAVLQKWAELGAEEGVMGFPTSDVTAGASGGQFSTFVGGRIAWSAATGAHEVHGSIAGRYAASGFDRGPLGYPTRDETVAPDGVGRYNTFTGGSVYWTPTTGAHSVQGAIMGKWASLGWERGLLGYPVTDETATPGGTGRYNHFSGGSVYWSYATGAHEVHGAIRSAWASMGWEKGALGVPVSDEYAVPGGRRSDFRGGSLTYLSATGAVTMTRLTG